MAPIFVEFGGGTPGAHSGAGMKVQEFLERFIDGYLLGDLRTMAQVPPPPAGEYGACGFSMVLITLAGAELLGALVSPTPFNPYHGSRYFERFWKEFMYPDDGARA